jgi:6-pyruvoyltetrahydropterin/6-carboxytetrahydropterin synthase
MATSPTILDSDFKYIDKKGTLLRTRTELTIAQMLTFLEEEYQYDHELTLKNGKKVKIDFKTNKGLIEVIDNDEDIKKYIEIKDNTEDKIMAVGHPKYSAQIKELEDIVFYDKTPQTGSIFLEDQSFTFDYAHILPLVEKCSILHGHTSSVMVELVGQMKNNLLVDFGVAKKIIKEVVKVIYHKIIINRKYLNKEDDSHYKIKFDGPKGMFDIQVPKNTTYLL